MNSLSYCQNYQLEQIRSLGYKTHLCAAKKAFINFIFVHVRCLGSQWYNKKNVITCLIMLVCFKGACTLDCKSKNYSCIVVTHLKYIKSVHCCWKYNLKHVGFFVYSEINFNNDSLQTCSMLHLKLQLVLKGCLPTNHQRRKYYNAKSHGLVQCLITLLWLFLLANSFPDCFTQTVILSFSMGQPYRLGCKWELKGWGVVLS